MSSTKRRKQGSEDGTKGTEPRRAGGRRKQTAPASPAPAGPEAPPAPASGSTGERKVGERKVSLPAFGFADDLLRQVRSEAEAGSADGEPAPSERIFTFADSLDAAARDEEEATAPVRLATWVTFRLAGETFALPVEPVREVLRVQSVTRVPHAPEPIRGVSNLRGRVIPVIDLRVRIGLPAADLDRASRVIVVGSRGRLLGLLVDAVRHVVHLDLDRVQAPPEDVMTVQSDYISGVYHLEDQLVLLLDVDRALIVREPESSAAEGGLS